MLKNWKKVKSKTLWLKTKIEEEMFNTLLILEQYFLAFAKKDKKFDKDKLFKLLYSWSNFDKIIDEIFHYL